MIKMYLQISVGQEKHPNNLLCLENMIEKFLNLVQLLILKNNLEVTM